MMDEIMNELQYKHSLDRIEELLQVVGNDTLTDDQNFIELNLLSDLVVEYEEKFHTFVDPSTSPAEEGEGETFLEEGAV